MVRIAINGLGRIGRTFLRVLLADAQAQKKLDLIAINIGPAKKDGLATMLKYDSLMGTYKGTMVLEGDELIIDGKHIKIFTEPDPACLPWKELHIDWVVEASGKFTKRDGAQKHLQAGAQAVLISAPAKDEDVTIIPGVNDAAFDPVHHKIVSLGSCTTNAFAPTLKVMHDLFGVTSCMMTTIHSYTNSQVLLDVEHKDIRRSRAAALNMIPTSTGAGTVILKVLPELTGCIKAMALRIPLAKVSLIDMTVTTKKPMTPELINQAFEDVAGGSMKSILGITMEPLVSSDFSGDPRSVVIDGLLTATCGDYTAKVCGWYDNEWGYSERLKDFLLHVQS